MLSFFGMQAASSTSDETKHSNNREESTPTINGPPSSLWPEPTRPTPTTTRGNKLNTTHTLDISNKACHALEDTDGKRGEIADTEYAVSSNNPTMTRTQFSSALRSSDFASDFPASRPIDITVPKVLEPHYPTWNSYPPIHPTQFDKSTPTSLPMDPPFNPIDTFLQQSNAFKNWVEKKNAERIQLRHGPNYEKLVDELHRFQRIYQQGLTPQARTVARENILRIKAEMLAERKKFSGAELQHIRDIENAWISLVSMDNYEQAISRQRHLSTIPQVEAKNSLSKVERLLGSDGSSPENYDWTQAPITASQPTLNKIPYNELGLGIIDSSVNDPKERPETASEKPPAAVKGSQWPETSHRILIPDWFYVFEARESIELSGATTEARFKYLLNYIHQLELSKRQREYKDKHPDEEGVLKDRQRDKNWHQPNPGWRHEHQRRQGGWWKCRKGPTATDAENKCWLCSADKIPEPIHPVQALEGMMKRIGAAMSIVAENDKNGVLGHISDESNKARQSHSPTAGPTTASFTGRQSLISYNPLRGWNDPPAPMASTLAHAQQVATDNKRPPAPNGGDISKKII
ncbi:hypothetical protein F4861DRAFT_550112 [Xylaria intraflava]|nr:hypothetical protein F4861DRAFT_550112 [Xylaria intraflava]